ncbi:MAG: LysR family transcriptional regulator, partial [Boseongicola sp. SB0664_bin_43]|nr:LysR family transcriptional regulator [Boseongicola sp. SB0664_bin_43]
MRGLLSRHLVHFVQIYDSGSIRAAADVLGLTQPALSKSLKQLEEHLGVILFERQQGGVEPTQFGDTLRRRANILDRELEYTTWEISALSGFETGTLRIGVGPVWSQRFLPRLLPAFCHRYPKIALSVETGSGSHFRHLIEEGKIDIYFGGDATRGAEGPLVFSEVRDLTLRFFAQEGHPIHDAASGDFARLEEYDWIGFTHQDDVAGIIREYAEAAGIVYRGLFVQVENFETLAMIGQGGPYLIFAPDILEAELASFGIRAIPIQNVKGVLKTGMMCRKTAMYLEPDKF